MAAAEVSGVVTLLLGLAALVAFAIPGAVAVAVAVWLGAADPWPFMLVPYTAAAVALAAYAVGYVVRAELGS